MIIIQYLPKHGFKIKKKNYTYTFINLNLFYMYNTPQQKNIDSYYMYIV